MTVSQGIKLGIFLLICAFIYGIFITSTNVIVDTNVDLEVQQIVKDDDEYYLLIDNHKLKISPNHMNQIDLDKYQSYRVIYKYNKVFSKKGGEIVNFKPYGKRI